MAAGHTNQSAQELICGLLAALDDFTGNAPPFDGVTTATVRRKPVSQGQAILHDWSQYRLRPEGMPAAQRRKAI